MRRLRIGMAQINTAVGDFNGNTARILDTITQAFAGIEDYPLQAGLRYS